MQVVARRFAHGERAPMLLDESGIPLYWPTLFCTVRLRNAGLAANTIKNRLNDLRVLLRWEKNYGRDLASEFRNGNFLTLADVVSIRDFAAKRSRRAKPSRASRGRIALFPEARLAPGTPDDAVSKQAHYQRLSTIASYVEFLGQTAAACREDADMAAAADRMAKRLRQHRPRGLSTIRDNDPLRKSPPGVVIESFIRVGSENHPSNPFRRGPIQRRNELVFRLLYETGIRLGELLSLRLDTLELGQEPYITVRRTHDDVHDTRAYQPVAKTKERILPIDDDLAYKIYDYVMKDRAKTPGATRHPYLLVTHRRGQTCGQPLSMSAIGNAVFSPMRRLREEFRNIHPHIFRHHLNGRVSERIDEHNRRVASGREPVSGRISSGREQAMRAHLNGHRSIRSGEVYNRRHVRESASKIVRDLQDEMTEATRQPEAEQ